MKAPEQITKAGLQIQKLNCGGLQIRRNWKNRRIKDLNNWRKKASDYEK